MLRAHVDLMHATLLFWSDPTRLDVSDALINLAVLPAFEPLTLRPVALYNPINQLGQVGSAIH